MQLRHCLIVLLLHTKYLYYKIKCIQYNKMATSVLKPEQTEVKLPNSGGTLCTTQGTAKMKRCIV